MVVGSRKKSAHKLLNTTTCLVYQNLEKRAFASIERERDFENEAMQM